MCILSNVGDWGRQQIWPQLPSVPDWQIYYQQLPLPDERDAQIERLKKELEKYKKFQALMEAAKEMDAVAGTPDCESPEKTDWIKDLDERMKKVELRLSEHAVMIADHTHTII